MLRVPIYQFLFVGYWFWGNILSPRVLPTLTDTWLNPIGGVAQVAFFPAIGANLDRRCSAADGVASIVLLLAVSAGALLAGLLVSHWQRQRD